MAGFLSSARADEKPDSAAAALSHREFVDRSLASFAKNVIAAADSCAGAPYRLVPAGEDSATTALARAIRAASRSLRPDRPIMRFQVREFRLALTQKTRRRFLGPFWVLRELTVAANLNVLPDSAGGGNSRRFEEKCQDWVRAADLKRLSAGEYSMLEVPPASDFVSRWAAPVAVSVGLGALTYLFFSVR